MPAFELPRAVWELKPFTGTFTDFGEPFELPRAVWELKPNIPNWLYGFMGLNSHVQYGN